MRETPDKYNDFIDLDDLKCKEHVNLQRASLSIATLGGGNHFIEMNKAEDQNIYLVVHSGSRHLGKQIAEYYQYRATKEIVKRSNDAIITELNDIAQKFAEYYRKAIAEVIIREMSFKMADSFTTIHNYIDLNEMILRKGAISAKKGEVVIIPINRLTLWGDCFNVIHTQFR